MSAHTPGPWKTTKSEMVETEDGRLVADVLTFGARRAADARLIAAAPDLLAALCEIVSGLESEDEDFGALIHSIASTAIAKTENWS